MYVPPGSPSFPPPMPPKRLNRFGGKKSVADLCGSRNWTAGAVDNLIPAIYSKRTLLARLGVSPSHPLPLLPSLPDVCLTKFEPPHKQRGGGSRA